MINISIPISFLAWIVFVWLVAQILTSLALAIWAPEWRGTANRPTKIWRACVLGMMLWFYWIVWHA